MLRWIVRGVLVLLVTASLVLAWDVATYDATPWRADYAHLRTELAQGYANLDWMIQRRGLDPAALDAGTDRAIADAHSRIQAILALRDFVEAFGDPHLRLVARDGQGTMPPPEAGAPARPPRVSCGEAGYSEEEREFSPAVQGLPGWTLLDDGEFPSGLAGDLGTLRIASFGEDRYLESCREVFRPGMDDRSLQLAVRARLQQALTRTLTDLRGRGARRLLVDVTGNGGGTEWVGDVIALMTDRELSRASARVVAPACDRSGIWRGEAVCPLFADGAGETSMLQGTGPWTGPLWILMDRRTGSASEDFVVWLQQNGVARTLGERTAGAGCGYVGGGGRIRLRTAPFDVKAPNCARFLRDGTNEVEGIAPDIEVSLSEGGDAEQAAALWVAIDAAPTT